VRFTQFYAPAPVCSPSRADIDGKSLAEVIASADAPTPHEAIHWQVGEDAGAQWAARDGAWKLIGNVRDTSDKDRGLPLSEADKKLFLSDLADDPGETRNHAADHPDVVDRLRALHEEWLRRVGFGK
jgi:arylsulfatase A-like enzyme